MSFPCYAADWSGTPPHEQAINMPCLALDATSVLPTTGATRSFVLTDCTVTAVQVPTTTLVSVTGTSTHTQDTLNQDGGVFDFGLGSVSIWGWDDLGNRIAALTVSLGGFGTYPGPEVKSVAIPSGVVWWMLFAIQEANNTNPATGPMTLHLDFFCASPPPIVRRARSYAQVIGD